MEENATTKSRRARSTQVMALPRAAPRQQFRRDGTAPCPTCGGGTGTNGDASHVYALGRIEARFRVPRWKKEFAQATGRAKTGKQTDRERSAILSGEKPLSRQEIVLGVHDPRDGNVSAATAGSRRYRFTVGGHRPAPKLLDIDVVIGPARWRRKCATAHGADRVVRSIYSFDRASLVDAIPRPEKIPPRSLRPADELFAGSYHR